MNNTIRFLLLLIFLSASDILFAEVHPTSFTSGGVELKAFLYEAEVEGSGPVFIYLHGNPGSPITGNFALAETMSGLGVHVFRFNYRGVWGNDGEFNLGNAIEDMSNAISFLSREENAGRFRIDPARITVGGSSFGSAAAFSGALLDTRVGEAIGWALCDHSYFGRQTMDPYSPIRPFLEEATAALFGPLGPIPGGADSFFGDLRDNIHKYDFVANAERLMDRRLYLLVGLDDMICPMEDHFMPLYRKLRANEHPNLKVDVFLLDHNFSGMPEEEVGKLFAEWLLAEH